MFEWLSPHVSSVLRSVAVVDWRTLLGRNLIIVVVARTVLNIGLTAIVARSVGFNTIPTGVAATGTLVSSVMMVFLLWSDFLGNTASNVELLIQFSLFVVVGYAVYSNPSLIRATVAVGIVAGAIVLAIFMIAVYGELFSAP